jgi:predicted P-loop ATPase
MNLFKFTKELGDIRCRVALEDQNNLLREKIKIIENKKIKDETDRRELSAQRNLWPIKKMKVFVSKTYEFRRNVITDVDEYRRVADGEKAKFSVINERELNTICIDIQNAGIFCLDRYVKQFIASRFANEYSPVTAYLNRIRGTWDGKDRIGELLGRINGSDYCARMGRIWMRAVVAQWLGTDRDHANSVMLLLVSLKQGMHKSTFLRSLLPPELSDYYTDDFSLNAKGNAQRKLVEYAIINMDEFDKEKPKKMPMLKTIMQTMKPSFIGAYKKNFNRLPRIASFTGTSNTRELLHDRSGSRRFLILEPDDLIRIDGIEHDQIYAQLLWEVENGKPYYFDKQSEQEMHQMNQRYYVKSAVENLFLQFFRAAREDEDCQPLTAEQIIHELNEKNHTVMKGILPNVFGRTLVQLNMPQVHTALCNAYRVIKL